MDYSIQELAALTGVTSRTLRWYDRIGLLKARRLDNGYRCYGPAEVDRLQQILFYRELGVELEQIRRILDDPAFDPSTALRQHLEALLRQQERVRGLIHTVERTLQSLERKCPMSDKEKFEAFKRQAVEENERSEEHTSELQSRVHVHLVCRLLLEIGRASCRERV